jgi:hypothetical protein
MANVERSIVGELINFRGMLYAPLNENGVFLLFGKVAEDLNMYVEEIRPEAPDAIVRRFTGKGWERLRVEFEYRSSQFRQHGEDSDRCDLIVCWEHDWADSPLEVVELRDRIREMENLPIHRPDVPMNGAEMEDLDEWFARHRVPDRTRALFDALAEHVKSIDETCFYRVERSLISFYSPQRAFAHVYPQQGTLLMILFTDGESLGNVEQIERRGTGRKWGSLSVEDQDQLVEAFPWVEESHRRITAAVRRNEPTGWRARLEEAAEEVVV